MSSWRKSRRSPQTKKHDIDSIDSIMGNNAVECQRYSRNGYTARILWSVLDESPCCFPEWLSALFPEDESYRIGRFVREADRRLRYAADVLLYRLIIETFGDCSDISVVRDCQGRPCLSGAGDADISISHSGDIVVCALSTGGRIGIDIEHIRKIDTSEFRDFFPESLLSAAGIDSDAFSGNGTGVEDFFHAWTRLESVLKADGRGFASTFDDILFVENMAFMDGNTWHLNTIAVADGYVCHLASAHVVSRCDVNRAVMFEQDDFSL